MTKTISGSMELDRLSIYKKWFDYFNGKYIGEFDCQNILNKIAKSLLTQIHVCYQIPQRDKKKRAVRRFLSRNRYLYKPNGLGGSFIIAFYIGYPLKRLKQQVFDIYSALRNGE